MIYTQVTYCALTICRGSIFKERYLHITEFIWMIRISSIKSAINFCKISRYNFIFYLFYNYLPNPLINHKYIIVLFLQMYVPCHLEFQKMLEKVLGLMKISSLFSSDFKVNYINEFLFFYRIFIYLFYTICIINLSSHMFYAFSY